MIHPRIADAKETNLYWRGPFAYFRKRIGTKDHWESMGELSLEAARRLIKIKRETAAEQAYLARWDLLKMRSDFSTFDELLAAYDLYTAGLDIEPNTVKGNKRAIGNIMRTMRGDGYDEATSRLSELTVGLIKEYEAAVIAARKARAEAAGWDKERRADELAAAARTAGSVWNQAKSLFSTEALASPAYRKLVLPDLEELRPLRIGSSSIVAYRRPAQSVLDAIKAAVPALKQSDPAMWLALNLEVNVAMRRKSGVWAKWDWLQDRGVDLDGRAVWMFQIAVAKGNQSEVRVDPDLAREMLALQPAGAEFIVPGRTDADRDEVFVRLCAWLRSMGLDANKPNHELRKWCADTMNARHGLTEAANMLGHSDQKLTSAVYVRHRTTKDVRVI